MKNQLPLFISNHWDKWIYKKPNGAACHVSFFVYKWQEMIGLKFDLENTQYHALIWITVIIFNFKIEWWKE